MSETIFVNIYWRQYFHENLQIILPEGAVVVAENLQKKRSLKITLATQLPSAHVNKGVRVEAPHFQFF